MPRQAPKPQSAVDTNIVRNLMNELLLEALRFIPQSRVAEKSRDWLGHTVHSPDGELDPRQLADAVGLASDLALFMPSASGVTAVDRLARQRKATDRAEVAAFEGLRRARFRVMRIDECPGKSVARLRDLASGEDLRVLDERIESSSIGLSLVGRTALLANGSHALIGAAPIDEPGLAVALGFVRPGAAGVNPQRCAEAVYRHVIRHGGPEVVGLNRLSTDENPDDFPLGSEHDELDALAHGWARRGSDAESAASMQRVRDLTSLDSVLNALGCSVMARAHGQRSLADAYARIADIQIETVRLRNANGVSGLSLSAIAAALAREIAEHGMPKEARAMFEALRRRDDTGMSGGGNGELDRLIAKIQALRCKTVEQGCTEQEALAAAEKVAELLDRYGLSLSAIELRNEACGGIGIDTGRRRLGPIDECVPSIATFFDCRAWIEKTKSAPIRHVFFGLRADIEAAHYLYDLVELAFTTETMLFTRGAFYAEVRSSERRGATNSFQVGLGRGIAGKLERLRQERQAAMRTSGRDLVPVKAAAVEDELAKLGLHFRAQNRPSSRYVMTDAFEAGQAAGERFEYRQGLASD